MSTSIAALPPPTHHIPHKPEDDDGPDVPEYAFSDLWQDKEEGMSFGDVVDIINPLQHIPIVSTIYRMATDDEAGMGSRLLGGALFGGPLGVLITGLTAIFEEVSGGSVEEHAASLWDTLTGEDNANPQIASSQEQDSSTSASPVIEADMAAIASPLIAQSREAVQQHTNIQLPSIAKDQLPPQSAERPVISLQPPVRPPVTVSPLTAIHRVYNQHSQTQAETLSAERSADSQRIAAAIEQAQRAQAGLLLANLGTEKTSDQPKVTDHPAPIQQAQPFKEHPYLLPRGAPPELISRAMEQAMAKYQSAMQQRAGAVIGSNSRTGPAPVE